MPSVDIQIKDGIIIYSKEEEKKIIDKWGKYLLGYIIGLNPHLPSLQDLLVLKWSLEGNLELVARGRGSFLLRFSKNSNLERVFSIGAWMVSGHLMLLKRWEASDPMEILSLKSIPIYVWVSGIPITL